VTEIDQWDDLKTSIEASTTLSEVKEFRDKAEAIRHFAQVSGRAEAVVRRYAELRLRAERRGGQLLLQMPKQGPGDYRRSNGVSLQPLAPTFEEQGIDKSQAHRWQRLASIPHQAFEDWVSKVSEITTVGALQVARQYQREKASFFRKTSMFREVTGRYAVILADPPWSYDDVSAKENRWGGAENHYSTISTEDLCSFRLKEEDREKTVPEVVEDDSLLFLWTTAPMLPDALKVMEAWGFEYKTVAFTWVKKNKDGTPFMGMGNYTRSNAEYCLLGIRGKGVSREDAGVHSIVESVRLSHSEKPGEVRNRIVTLVGDVPRIELFARAKVKGWDCYGDQLGAD